MALLRKNVRVYLLSVVFFAITLLGGFALNAQNAGDEEIASEDISLEDTAVEDTRAPDVFEIDVTGGVIKPYTIAIPDFEGEAPDEIVLGQEIANIVAQDLLNSGYFLTRREIAPHSFSTRFNRTWLNNEPIDLYVSGAVSMNDMGAVEVKFRLYEAVSESERGPGLRFSGAGDEWRRMGHKVADEIYTRMTGNPPYFDSQIAFVAEEGPKDARRAAIAVMDSDGANLRYLTDGQSLVLDPILSPNQRDIVYTSFAGGKPSLVMMNMVSGEIYDLPFGDDMTFAPAYSPDGLQLAFSMSKSGNTDIYVMDMTSFDVKRLTSTKSIDTSPDFTPDGKKVVFESNITGKQQIYSIPVEGGKGTRLSKGNGRYATPTVSPDGKRIAFTKIVGENFHIGVMDIDGENEVELTTSYHDEAPVWAPNSQEILFTRQHDGDDEGARLYSISVSGQNFHEVTTPSFASYPYWSPVLQ